MGQSSSRMACSNGCGCEKCDNGQVEGVSAETKRKVTAFLNASNKRTDEFKLAALLSPIPKDEDVLLIYDDNGFNLLQKFVAENNVKAVKLILSRNPDLNNGLCSLPLHIACLNGYKDCVQELVEHGARLDIEARMCWPGPHRQNCRGIKHECKNIRRRITLAQRGRAGNRRKGHCQNALYYALDGDKADVLGFLLEIQDLELHTSKGRKPLLDVACERQAWNCCAVLMENRTWEINFCCFRLNPGPGSEMNLLHVLFLMVRKPAEFILRTCNLLLENGLRSGINDIDSMGNTPLQSLLVRYGFESTKLSWTHDSTSWADKDVKSLVQLLLRNGATESINQPGNSAIAHAIRNVPHWGFCYELLSILLRNGGDPNVKGRDGNFPLMVCLTPIINSDPSRRFTEEIKVCYMNCLEILCQYGANTNCTTVSKLTPLHVLVLSASDNLSLLEEEAKVANFTLIRDVLIMLFQFGLDPNVGITDRAPNVFQGVVEMVKNSRSSLDMEQVYAVVLTLTRYGVNPNMRMQFLGLMTSYYGRGSPFLIRDFSYALESIFVVLAKKNQILNGSSLNFARVLYLFYYSMDHDELFNCLHLLFIQLHTIPPESPCQILCDIITDMYSRPRTLKQLARIAVHRSINRRPGLYAKMLPIPLDLQNYLLNFEP